MAWAECPRGHDFEFMQRSKVEVYIHLVWSTYYRAPWITAEVERAVYRCIADEATRCNCNILAINGMPDHVHLVVTLPSTVSLAKLMQAVKGTSSAFARDLLPPGSAHGWQDNYAAFSVSRSHLKRVIDYVQNQKQHHASANLWDEWEQTFEPS